MGKILPIISNKPFISSTITSFKISIALSKWKFKSCSCKIYRISKHWAFGFKTSKIKMESLSKFCRLNWSKYQEMQPYVMKDSWRRICLVPRTWIIYGELSPRIKLYLKYFSCRWLVLLNFKDLSLFLLVYGRFSRRERA